MANDTFNPNSYGDTQIANALKYALEDHAAIPDMQSDIAANTGSVSALRTANSNLLDLIEQIIYRGSDNIIQLDPENMTVTGDLTAALHSGILHIVKDSTSTNPVITITGLDIPAGTWYLGVPNSRLMPLIVATLYDGLDVVAMTNPLTSVSEPFTVDTAITGGSLEIEVDKMIVTDGLDITPYIADKELSAAMPYFRPLTEVMSNA